MAKFWRLFTSDYVQNFVDSVSIPTSDELAKSYVNPFSKEVKLHKERMKSFF